MTINFKNQNFLLIYLDYSFLKIQIRVFGHKLHYWVKKQIKCLILRFKVWILDPSSSFSEGDKFSFSMATTIQPFNLIMNLKNFVLTRIWQFYLSLSFMISPCSKSLWNMHEHECFMLMILLNGGLPLTLITFSRSKHFC